MQLSERGKTMLAFGTLSVLAVAFEIALLANSEPLQPSGPLAAMLDRGLDTVRAGRHGAPGLSIAIVRDGKIAYTYARGYANVTTQSKVTPDTRFRAASVTKMFTALSIMQLVEAGRMSLDANVATYLPAAPHASEITIRELLSHTSGLPNLTDMAFSTGLVANPTTPQKMLAPLVSQPLDFAAGSKYEYSNSNDVVLAQIVETLEGRPLADVVRERIFATAAMTQSSFTSSSDASIATGYDDAAATKPSPFYDESWLYGAGDLVTSATDLARFDIALMNGKIVTMQTLATMQQPLEPMGDANIGYGLGFMSAPLGTKTLVGHHGGIPGFQADDEMIVKDRFAIVALGNSTEFSSSGVNGVAIALLLPTDFALAETAAIHSAASGKGALDPAVEAKMRAFLNGIANDDVDHATLTPQMDAALTSSAVTQISATLPKYATLQRLTLVQHSTEANDDVYVVAARYAATNQDYEISFDRAGKIAGFFLR